MCRNVPSHRLPGWGYVELTRMVEPLRGGVYDILPSLGLAHSVLLYIDVRLWGVLVLPWLLRVG